MYGMPKYEYPSHIYNGNRNTAATPTGTGIISTSAEERRAFFGGENHTDETSESEEESDEEQADFFSNAEFLGAKSDMERWKRESSSNNVEDNAKNSFSNSSNNALKEGSAYIEGGSSYQ